MQNKKTLLKIKKSLLLTTLGLNLLLNDLETTDENQFIYSEGITTENPTNHFQISNNEKIASTKNERASDILSQISSGINNIIDIHVKDEEQYIEDSIKLYKEATLEKLEELKNKYYDVPCSTEYQDYLREMCLEYNVPFRVLMTIGHNESGGEWNTNGHISKTNDLGVFQINKCNVDYINKNLGYTYDDLLNDEYKNGHSAIFILSEICAMYEQDDFENIFGTYNGWTDWKKKEQSKKYVEHCLSYLNDIFYELPYDQELKQEEISLTKTNENIKSIE